MRSIGLFVINAIPCVLYALSPPQMFDKKDGSTNHFAVTTVLMAMNEQKNDVKSDWSDASEWLVSVVSNGKASISKRNVIKIEYGNGVRSYSAMGKNLKWRLFLAGAWFKKAQIIEVVNGHEITHVQTYPINARIRNWFDANIKSSYKLNSDVWLSDLNDMDHRLASGIMSGDRRKQEEILREFGHKVYIESQHGRTMYLRLDNPINGHINVLRFKGVRPRRRYGLFIPDLKSYAKKVTFKDGKPILSRKKTKVNPLGTMAEKDAENEYEMGYRGGFDESLAMGRYNLPSSIGMTGFVVYGMDTDDSRVHYSGNYHWERNVATGDLQRIYVRDSKFFKDFGSALRSMHDGNVVHGELHLGNVGIQREGLDRVPMIRDFESAKELSPTESIEFRTAWKFVDVVWPIFQWMESAGQGFSPDNYVANFLQGYFGTACDHKLIDECVSKFVYGKAKQMDGRGMNIPDNFPNLYMALIVNEISQDPHFDQMFKEQIDAEMKIFDRFNKSS